jgi:hypothetical protein
MNSLAQDKIPPWLRELCGSALERKAGSRRSRIKTLPAKVSSANRFSQLSALAADPCEDTAECAQADLFHELPNDPESLLGGDEAAPALT